jgi:putative addiction module component (TIGR02574 family)
LVRFVHRVGQVPAQPDSAGNAAGVTVIYFPLLLASQKYLFRSGLASLRKQQYFLLMGDLKHQIEGLSPAEKFELLDVVWESLEADALSLTEAQRAEIDYRIAQYEQFPSDVIPWEQVRADLFKKS